LAARKLAREAQDLVQVRTDALINRPAELESLWQPKHDSEKRLLEEVRDKLQAEMEARSLPAKIRLGRSLEQDWGESALAAIVERLW
jgi:hypothetical protein